MVLSQMVPHQKCAPPTNVRNACGILAASGGRWFSVLMCKSMLWDLATSVGGWCRAHKDANKGPQAVGSGKT